jgi:2-iminobutanoate/2-iminopropanoate deaminase
MKRHIFTEKAPKPIGPYNQAVKAGNFLFVSGQLAIDPKQGKIIVETITLQTMQVMENIDAILQAAGYSLNDLVQTTVYLSSLSLFDEFNTEYSKFLAGDLPSRSTVGCELKTGALVEISAVAYKE